jgi:hypothetical protein
VAVPKLKTLSVDGKIPAVPMFSFGIELMLKNKSLDIVPIPPISESELARRM